MYSLDPLEHGRRHLSAHEGQIASLHLFFPHFHRGRWQGQPLVGVWQGVAVFVSKGQHPIVAWSEAGKLVAPIGTALRLIGRFVQSHPPAKGSQIIGPNVGTGHGLMILVHPAPHQPLIELGAGGKSQGKRFRQGIAPQISRPSTHRQHIGPLLGQGHGDAQPRAAPRQLQRPGRRGENSGFGLLAIHGFAEGDFYCGIPRHFQGVALRVVRKNAGRLFVHRPSGGRPDFGATQQQRDQDANRHRADGPRRRWLAGAPSSLRYNSESRPTSRDRGAP